jgi:serine/threonine protein kinase
MIEVLETSQIYVRVSGGLQFHYTRVLYLQKGTIFCAKLPYKLSEQAMDPDKLEDVRPLSSKSYCPLHIPSYTVAPDPDQCFVKRPNLRSFENEADLTGFMLQELATCEIIRIHPHPNVATYYGCRVMDGRVDGLCFKRYRETMMEKLNPGNFNKSMFVQADDRVAIRKKAAIYLPDIEAAIRHLHSVGRVHNDINPNNIMFDEDRAVIIDFDSSRVPGAALDKSKRTYGWYDPDVCESQESNDLNALEELRIWLTSSSPSEFQFGW